MRPLDFRALSVRAADLPRERRRRRARIRLLWQWSLFLAGVLALGGTVLGLAFAGSPERLPDGTRIAGVDVAGLTPSAARARLERRESERGSVPVVFTADGHRWRVKPATVVLDTDWGAAVEAARRQGEGFAPLRGLKRLGVRVFGADVVPRTRVSEPVLDAYLDRFERAIDSPRIEPALTLNGLEPQVVAGRPGRVLDREAAAEVIVRGLTGLPGRPVELPLRIDRPRLAVSDLAGARVKLATALSAPIDLAYGPGGWHLSQRKIARILELPHDGSRSLQIAGPAADRFFRNLRKRVEHAPKDAGFAVGARNIVRVVPAEAGRRLDPEATERALLTAMLSPTDRRAELSVASVTPERTTREAKAMGITGVVGAYETFYGGVPNRIHNVQLVAHLLDNHLIAPGAEFSFNGTTGERSPEKGFLEAPVIINGELKTGLGGGVCQVSTTTFNAAYEAGLPITDRTNHALYISHYPLGRDATVNYPDTDLKFVNDTEHWLWLRTFVGSSSLTVALYGAPQNRRVESDASALRVIGPAPTKRVPDPSLLVGQTALEEYGQPARATSVRRQVFSADGELLYDHTWYSSYRAEPRVIRVGTKKPKPAPPVKKKKKPAPPPPPEPPASPPPPTP
jgi:vancomycin resistance protein YoaR